MALMVGAMAFTPTAAGRKLTVGDLVVCKFYLMQLFRPDMPAVYRTTAKV
jgi:hypothetical protein